MRNGKLLAEKPPIDLMHEHNATLLEDVVLKLCRKDTDEQDRPVAVISRKDDGDWASKAREDSKKNRNEISIVYIIEYMQDLKL